MYRVENANFSIGKKKILSNIEFTIKGNEIFTIIGPNGSGKTTLFRLLTGLYSLNSGDIYIDGEDIKSMNPVNLSRKIAVISQNVNIQFPFTCFEIVMMGRNPQINSFGKPKSKDYECAFEAMEKTGTLEYKDRLITELSGGEKQRIMLARAIAQGANYIFLDEAFSEMDIHYAIESMKLLKRLVDEENITIVNIVHDINMAYHFSDRVLLLKSGEVYGIGTKDEIMKNDKISDLFNIRVESIKDKGMLIIPYI